VATTPRIRRRPRDATIVASTPLDGRRSGMASPVWRRPGTWRARH